MEEAVRADHAGSIVPSLAETAHWINDTTLELKLREGVHYHDNQPFTSWNVRQNFDKAQPWAAPHPPGTWLNFPKETKLEVVDNHTVRFIFPSPDGQALGKMRANHLVM